MAQEHRICKYSYSFNLHKRKVLQDDCKNQLSTFSPFSFSNFAPKAYHLYHIMYHAHQVYDVVVRDLMRGNINDETDIYEHYTKDGFEKANPHVLPITGGKKHPFVSFMPTSALKKDILGNLAWFSSPECKPISSLNFPFFFP